MTFDMLSDLIEIAFIKSTQPGVIKQHPDMLSKIHYRLQLLSAAKKDSGKAQALLSANISPDNKAFPLLDFTRWPDVHYILSGELQTPESEAYFETISSAAVTLRNAIVDAERAKGSPTLHILEQILALNSALPERYKAMANIVY